jgi:NADH:ubiquinone oxidoreductase subunit H
MHWITTLDDLHALYGTPAKPALAKVTPHLTPAYATFIARSRFCILTTVGPEGTDGSPRGDIGPVVTALDAKTLALPDWKGNERIDSLRNILRDGRVSLIFLIAGFAETNRAPFDLPEADAELVGGYITEYGGGGFTSYFFAEYLNVIVVSAVTVTVYLGGWLLPFGWHTPGLAMPFVVIGKTALLIFLFMWVRATLPRLRYDQLMTLGWKVLLPIATINTLVTAVLVVS